MMNDIKMARSKIVATGAYIPSEVMPNKHFSNHTFYQGNQSVIPQDNDTIINKFKAITGIRERRYAPENMSASDMGALAAKQAIEESGIDSESIDQIIVAHNYGDMDYLGAPRDMVPSLASRVKHILGIENPACIPYDILFGCPGWLQGIIQADQAIRIGAAKTCLVIGAETLSRVLDPTDRDSMIFSDGAGACILQLNTDDESGLINSLVRSDTTSELEYIYSGAGNDGQEDEKRYIKMLGRKVYEYALKYVPLAMKDCFDKSGEQIDALKMVFLHQANEKMDQAIIDRFFELYGIQEVPQYMMPMNISFMGNSSVATIPTLLHQVLGTELDSYNLQRGDVIMMASVGAGMNINAITYRW